MQVGIEKSIVKVRAVYSYIIDVSEIDPEQIDVQEYSKELTKSAIGAMIDKGILTKDDFEYETI